MDWKFIFFGFLLHIILFYSIFDIYFTSPIIHGVPHHSNPLTPPANRLVLFSADGLRADKFFEITSQFTPYLRNVTQTKGRWGISHTRVPTESRPGHVAMIAGFYEDVSAVAKGWKENPVEFDSVFNQSKQTFAWGSPDILPMFSKGSSGDRVLIHTYPPETEDFATNDFTTLDTWVFKEFEKYLKSHNETTKKHLKDLDGLIFFLHLLALDTTGHVHKPYSHYYGKSMKVVDEGVRRVVEVIEDFFGHDGKTSYIFTSDHGMTDWGSHGAGSDVETQTPFMAWGAGVATDLSPYHLEQADICVLMSTLLGLPISLQSVGKVPFEILDVSDEFKATTIFTNVQQLYEQYKAKMLDKKTSTFSFMFTPYKLHNQIVTNVLEMGVLLSNKQYQQIISTGRRLMEEILDGFQYYHKYERTQLGLCVCLSYVGWMLYIATLLLQHNLRSDRSSDGLTVPNASFQRQFYTPQNGQHSPKMQKLFNYVFSALAAVIILTLYAQSRPLTHYIYFSSAFSVWFLVASRGRMLRRLWDVCKDNVVFITCTIIFLEAMIFSFSRREMLSLILFIVSLWGLHQKKYLFVFSCFLSSIFPLLPTVGKTSNYLLVYASCLVSMVHFSLPLYRIYGRVKIVPFVFKVQWCVIGLSGFLVWWFERQRSSPTPSFINLHVLSWLILASSYVLPLFSPRNLPARTLSLSMSFCAPQMLLSIAHESFFYVSLCALCYSWLVLESKKNEKELNEECFREGAVSTRALQCEDVRRACFYLFLFIFSFFGTGNIASINSFDPTSILAFVSVFNPFVMGFLCIFRVLNPLQLTSCFFQAIQFSINIPPYPFFLLLLIISDFMACHFFFMVRDSGSWLDIGISISHYVIIMSFIIFFFILFMLSKVLTHTRLYVKNVFNFSRVFYYLKNYNKRE